MMMPRTTPIALGLLLLLGAWQPAWGASVPSMKHLWSLHYDGWSNCPGKSSHLYTKNYAECTAAAGLGWSGACSQGAFGADHYVMTTSVPGAVKVYRMALKNACGCSGKDSFLLTTSSSWKSSLESSGWYEQSGESFYAWPATSPSQVQQLASQWGLVPVWHAYHGDKCDNVYTEHTSTIKNHYAAGYTFGPSSEPVTTDPQGTASGSYSVAYMAADGYMDLSVGCSGVSSCSWMLEGPGGWSISSSGTKSYSKVPSHRYQLTCYDVPGMSNDTGYTAPYFDYFSSQNLTCNYSCDNECSPNQKQCYSDGYRTCQSNGQGCWEWSSVASCDDGVSCTSDGCSNGVCTHNTNDWQCDDGNVCTSDTCNTWGCSHNNASGSCNDGNACTNGDYCSGGGCQAGSPKVCVDGNPCTDDSCNSSNGVCQFLPNMDPCNDGDPCTDSDSCSSGACSGYPKQCGDENPCTGDICSGGSCVNNPLTGPACNDDDACTQQDACSAGSCKGVQLVCDDGNLCTSNECVGGSCVFNPINGSTCTDGDPCTVQDVCGGGGCSGTPLDCDDANPCTSDACLGGACQHTSQPGPCDDGSACTTGDSCSNGVCVGGPPPDCDDSNPCTADVCDPSSGCQHPNQPGPCEDGDACSVGDQCVAGGCMAGASPPCNDSNPCTTDSCKPATGCQFVPNSDPCDDQLDCTTGDVCSGGVCSGLLPDACDDGVPCTEDSCAEGEGCAHLPINAACSDGNPCTDDACDAAAGCQHVHNQAPCSDGNPCTDGDGCDSGLCLPGSATDCGDDVGCTVDACDPVTGCQNAPDVALCDDGVGCTIDACDLSGGCTHTPTPSACDDGDPCTTDACDPSAGCDHALGALTCDDGNVCTTDSCVPGVGCAYVPNKVSCVAADPCTVGSKCAEGVCQGGIPMACEDGNPCTTGYCDPASGCLQVPVDGPCQDGDECTDGDTCVAGECKGVASASCWDGNPCTTDTCDPAAGCVFPDDDGADCTDGDPCTVNDACMSGLCLPGPPNPCDDGFTCTADACEPDTGCQHAPEAAKCDDGNPCTLDLCTLDKGCTHESQGGICVDHDECTTDEHCTDGSCTGVAIQCDDGNPCTTDSCSAAIGCVFSDADGVPCSDGNPCTVADQCESGLCLGGGAKDCVDEHPCTLDSCDPGSGCAHAPDDSKCDDGVACTVDTCSPISGCLGTPDASACTPLGACDAVSCHASDGCVHTADPDICSGGADLCNTYSCDATYACQPAPKDCDDADTCTDDGCDPGTGACTHLHEGGCCGEDADCPLPASCEQSKCINHQCVVIPGCVAGHACAFGGCHPVCVPPKETTKCSDSGDTLYECLTDASNESSAWIASACSAGTHCAFNGDIEEFHCCEPNCADRECGSPSTCMVPCGACDEGYACAGPNEAFTVAATDPNAFQCIPGCADTDPDRDWSIELPECGPSLPGTVADPTCGTCSGITACVEGRCIDQCEVEEIARDGRCSDSVAEWCEDGAPKQLDCGTEGSYCCPGDARENQIGRAACCSCALECDAKGWECGSNSCGDACGLEDTDDGCPDGYDCQGRSCVCMIASLCGSSEAEPDATTGDGGPSGTVSDLGPGGLDVDATPAPRRNGGCRATGRQAPWLLQLLFLLLAVCTWRRTRLNPRRGEEEWSP